MARATATRPRERTHVTRQRVLETALRLVDTDGLDALSMRKLGAELGTEAMSVYKHVANKDALLDGLVEQLWYEVRDAIPDSADWADQLRALAHAVRATMHRHPQAASLLVSRCVLPVALLDTYATLLDTLREAGFSDAASARAVRSLCGYALGYVSSELYCLGAWRVDPNRQPACDTADVANVDKADLLLWLGRTLPAETPSRLVNAAVTMIDADPDHDFDASLDLAIQGLQQRTITPA